MTAGNSMHTVVRRSCGSLSWIHFYLNMTAIYDKYLERVEEQSSTLFLFPFLEICHRISELADSDDYIRDMKINSELELSADTSDE